MSSPTATATSANALVAKARSRIHEAGPDQLCGALADHTIIDVREPGEFDAGHLPGAVNIPRGVLEFEIEAHPATACATHPALADRDRALLLYCRSGGRSALASESLQRLGFRRVVSLAGGIVAWREAGLPVIMDR